MNILLKRINCEHFFLQKSTVNISSVKNTNFNVENLLHSGKGGSILGRENAKEE